MNFNFLRGVFSLFSKPEKNGYDISEIDQGVTEAMAWYEPMSKEHREFYGEQRQESALKNIVPLLANETLLGSFNDMKQAFQEHSDLVGVDQIRDFVNKRMPPQVVKQISQVAIDYRLAAVLLDDEADERTKAFMQAYQKAQTVYGRDDVFAAYLGVSAAIDMGQALYSDYQPDTTPAVDNKKYGVDDDFSDPRPPKLPGM